MNKRVLSVVCLLLAFVFVFSACATTGGAKAVMFEQVEGDGIFAYDLVRPAAASDLVEKMITDMRKALKDTMDLTIILQRDTIADSPDKYEILVGVTNRPESQECVEILKNNRTNNLRDFIIKCTDRKICIVGLTDESLQTAVDLFIKTFCGSREDWQRLSTEFEYLYAPEATGSHIINDVQLGDFTIVTIDKPAYIYSFYVEQLDKVYAEYNYAPLRAIDTDPATEYEIIVGDTFRPESKAVQLENNDYVIKVVGNKVILKGATDLATSHAVQKFLAMLEEKPDGINLKDGFTFTGNIADSPEQMQGVLLEDFEGNSFHPKYWGSFCAQTEPTDGSIDRTIYTTSIFGGKVYYYGMSGCRVENSQFVCTAGMINDVDCYQSGISTQGRFGFRYGVVDIYSKIAPGTVGTSYFTNDFETLGAMNEINIVETMGRPFTQQSNMHSWARLHDQNNVFQGFSHFSTSSTRYAEVVTPTTENYLSDEYHMWSINWTKEGVYFAFDGKTFWFFDLTKETRNTALHTYSDLHLINHLGEATYPMHQRYDPDKEGRYFEGYMDYINIYQDSTGDYSFTPRKD